MQISSVENYYSTATSGNDVIVIAGQNNIVLKNAAQLQNLNIQTEYNFDGGNFYNYVANAIFSGTSGNDQMENYGRHTTVNGDRLDKLAEKYLHDADRWGEIYSLNSNQLSNKDVVPIGIVLIIPAK